MNQLTPLTRDGTEPRRGGREAVAAAMSRLLGEGQRYALPDADVEPEELRSWATRLQELARDLADCVEAPARNRVMEVLACTSVPDDTNALLALRINVAGASYEQLGQEVGVSGRTIERVEDGEGCRVGVAKKLADRFALRTTEFFDTGRTTGESIRCRTVGELREVMVTPRDELVRG
jgi:DNA-binding XRE family transcriptional regulator